MPDTAQLLAVRDAPAGRHAASGSGQRALASGHYLSHITELQPGDVILGETPAGVGAFHSPRRWLVPGDVIEVTIPGMASLRNRVADAA